MCGAPPLYTSGYCYPCIEAAREQARCPDCHSIVTVAIIEGDCAMHAFVEHDETCPAYGRLKAQGLAT